MDRKTPLDQLRANSDKIIACAKLSHFAYDSAAPNQKISLDDGKASEKLYNLLKDDLHWQPQILGAHPHDHFARFASYSWWRSSKSQFKWFRSQSYFCHYFDQKADVNRIILGFRGTWMDDEGGRDYYNEPRTIATWWARYGPPAWYNTTSRLLSRWFAPANIGLFDIYYDAIVIRIPYTSGTVWKWWAYWGSLVLERTRLWMFMWLFYPARISAADWISLPNHSRITSSNPRAQDDPAATPTPVTIPSKGSTDSAQLAAHNLEDQGDVHLGFWSLWAAPEGFAGYDRFGHFPNGKERLLPMVRKALDSGEQGKKSEILVVGHSLGGAVSCFAALDIARRLEVDEDWKKEDVKIFHATFGAPPVGDPVFQRYFNKHFNKKPWGHESWSIYHE